MKIYWGNNEKIQFIFHCSIYWDSYHRKYFGFDAYYPFYNEVTNSILIALHPRYSSEIIVLNFSLKENKVDAKDVSYTDLYIGEKLIMYKCFFAAENGKFLLFGLTNYNIYEVEIVNDYGWKLVVKNKFYNHFGNAKGSELIIIIMNIFQ